MQVDNERTGDNRSSVATSLLRTRLTAAFLLAALVLGGAGLRYPIIGGALQVAAIALLLTFALQMPRRKAGAGAHAAIAGALALLLLFIFQLVPLPTGLSLRLPGRELASQIWAISGSAGAMHPLTLDPDATR